ncbi:polyol transporter 5-like [Syzygium oleosum]|uniref:polyol transporter 5-like n=1 Tax=Syzygium oleosum TaxID=219896 RepID=UPI0024BA6C55|nr:polyol transporter 5-like [Syzygium oleosum]
MGFTHEYTFLVLGLDVANIDVDYTFIIALVYIAEVSSAFSHSFFTSFPEMFINVGTMLATSPSVPSPSSTSTSGGMSSLVWEQSLWSFLSSRYSSSWNPSWLVMQGRLGDTKHFLTRTSDSQKEVALRRVDINEAVDIPKECNKCVVKITKQSAGESI